MTLYEIAVSVEGDDEPIVVSVSGAQAMSRALDVFNAKAHAGRIPGATQVHLYEQFDVSGEILAEVITELGARGVDIDRGSVHTVTLFET